MSEIVIYKSKDGRVQLDIQMVGDTLWLSQNQMAVLFGTKRPAITKHLKNIFNSGELFLDSVCSKMERTAGDGKKYKTQFYNLDAVISVGYRVNSDQATQFRIWATQVLKAHLINGYTTYEKRLAECGLKELQQAIDLLQKTLTHNHLVNDIGVETIQLIMSYTKTWQLLLAYDENELSLPEKSKVDCAPLNYNAVLKVIETLKSDLKERGEASDLFGRERDSGLEAILGNIEQTFDGESLYSTVEERAANLLYFIIKDHPFSDGNKRIGCLVFLLFLKLQNVVVKINDNGLVALALLLAESDPSQKELMIRLIVNLLID